MINQTLEQLATESGMYQYGWVNPQTLTFHEEVRGICASNGCGLYGTNWACPPACGSLEECETACKQYQHMLIFTNVYQLEDSFDFEGMTDGMKDFKKRLEQFHEKLKPLLTDYLILGNEGCHRCETCTYPDAPCRFPDKLYPTVEGYGFIVNELAQAAGIAYNNGPNTVTYFGAVLFNA